MTSTSTPELPPLPERTGLVLTMPNKHNVCEVLWEGSMSSDKKEPIYTADQMRKYAALSRAQAAAQPAAQEKALALTDRLRKALEADTEFLGKVGGCADGGCIVATPKGVHTNGGCKCSKDYIKMQRLGYAHRKLVEAVSSALLSASKG